MALVLGIVGTSIGLARARVNLTAAQTAERREATQRKQAEAVAGMLESMFHRLDPRDAKYGGTDLRADLIDELQQSATTLDKDPAVEPLVRSRLRDSLGWTMSGLGKYSRSVAAFWSRRLRSGRRPVRATTR